MLSITSEKLLTFSPIFQTQSRYALNQKMAQSVNILIWEFHRNKITEEWSKGNKKGNYSSDNSLP